MIYTIENRILIKFTYFHKKSIASKTYFLFMYVRDLPLLKRQTTCIQIQRDRKKFWDIKIFVIWIAYPWDIQQIRIPVYQIIGTFHFIPHPSCTDFTNKTNSNWKYFFMFESIVACFSHGESQTHLYCPRNCQKNGGAHQRGKAVTGSQAVCRLECNGVVM